MMLFRTGLAPTQPPERRRLQISSKGAAARGLDVLLLDAEYRQTLAAMRAYGRAGLTVGSIACDSEADWAPSLKSRWCTLGASVPDFAESADGYVDALLGVLDAYPVHMVMPAHDGSMRALRTRRLEVERRTALPLASEAALDIAVSKVRTLELATKVGIPVPRGVSITSPMDIGAALREIGSPLVVKPYESWVERKGGGRRLSSEAFNDLTRARRRLEKIFAVGGPGAVVQQWLPGRREAVSLFYADGRFWARLAQISYREWPVMGGASVLCETIPLLPDITAAAERLVEEIGLEGCSMVEFRRDADGHAILMEVNPRLGGSLQLAINSGVNFPMLAFDWKVRGKLTEAPRYRPGQRMRWLVGDIWNLKTVLEFQGDPDVPSSRDAVRRFVLDFLRPGNRLDVFDFGDMRPAVAELNRIVLRHGMNRVRGLFDPSLRRQDRHAVA